MKYTKKIAALVAAIALVGTAQSAYALRTLTEAEKMAVIAEYLAEREAKEAAKAPEPAPEVKAEAPKAEAEPLKVTIEVTKVEAEKPAETPKVEAKVAEVKTEKVETKAEPAPTSVDVKVEVDGTSLSEKDLWHSGPRPAGVDFPLEMVKGVATVHLPATLNVSGKTVEISHGNVVAKILPDRGLTVSLADLQTEVIPVVEVKGGKAFVKELPNLATWPADKPVSFEQFSCLEDFLRLEPYGLVVTACGVNNTEEAIRGRPMDNPVRTMATLEDVHMQQDGRISGVRKLYDVATRQVKSAQYYDDFSGVVYWVQMRVPNLAMSTKGRPIHWRSAKYRAELTVANDAAPGQTPQAFLTVMFGAQEGTERKVGGRIVGSEGRENTIPARPLVRLNQADQVKLIEDYMSKKGLK